MSTFNEVWRKLQSKEYRSAFVKAQFKRLVPFQIRALRKQRGWSQEELAECSRLTQGVISRAEDSDYGNLTVNTILKIADGFDVAFVGRFAAFSELDEWFIDLSERTVQIPNFEEENRFFETGRLFSRRVSRTRRMPRSGRKLGTRLVYIDTRRPTQLPNAGQRQLSLPLSGPIGDFEKTALKLIPQPQTKGDARLSCLVQPTPVNRAQIGGGI